MTTHLSLVVRGRQRGVAPLQAGAEGLYIYIYIYI